MARNCWKMASGQTGSRLAGSCAFGVERSRTAIKLAKSAAFVGAGKSQETSLAESGALAWIGGTVATGVVVCSFLQATGARVVASRIPRTARFGWREEVRDMGALPS